MTTTKAPALPPILFVNEGIWKAYHERRRDIYKLWPPLVDDVSDWDIIASMRAASLADLRRELREAASQGGGGPYMIAVG